MRNIGLVLVAGSIACALPEGEMGSETETETDSSGSSSGTDGATTADSTVTLGTSMGTSPGSMDGSTTVPQTTDDTVDPDSSSTGDADSSSTTAGECIPGQLGCACDVGSTCEGELFCVEGTCMESLPCDEPEGEPNDDEASAVELDEASCSSMSSTIDAGISGAESDWYTFHADGGFGCVLEKPSVTVAAETDLAVCIFALCDDGDLLLDCAGDAEESDSPDGAPGCCAQNTVALSAYSCGFMGTAPGTGNIWARVTSVENACVPYTLEWDY